MVHLVGRISILWLAGLFSELVGRAVSELVGGDVSELDSGVISELGGGAISEQAGGAVSEVVGGARTELEGVVIIEQVFQRGQNRIATTEGSKQN